MAANRQTYIHTTFANAVTLVWGSLRLVPISPVEPDSGSARLLLHGWQHIRQHVTTEHLTDFFVDFNKRLFCHLLVSHLRIGYRPAIATIHWTRARDKLGIRIPSTLCNRNVVRNINVLSSISS